MDEENKKDSESTSTSEEKTDENEEKKDDATEGEEEEKDDYDWDKETENRKGGSKYSPLEKAQNSLKSTIAEVTRDGGDPSKFFEGSKKAEEGDKEQKGVTLDDMRAIVREEMGGIKSSFAKAEVETRVSKLAKNDKEKALTIHLFDNRIVRSDNLDEDVDDAWWLANKNRIKATMAELGRGNKAKKKSSGESTGQKRETSEKGKPSSQEEAFAKKRGLTWSEEDGRFISKAKRDFLKKNK